MGAGQIGGIATLLDIDFDNAAGFLGEKAMASEAQYMVYYFSQAMMFCVGALIEAHIVLTPARCLTGETHKFEVFGGTHTFLENSGISRMVHHVGIHKEYNVSSRWADCKTKNLALLVLNKPFSFSAREPATEYMVNRLRYGLNKHRKPGQPYTCSFTGWGSRRNGYLIPLLLHAHKLDVTVLRVDDCAEMWNKNEEYLCIQQLPCENSRYGALCPDDAGSVLVCSGFAQGMMTSSLVDRPCGVGFLDLTKFTKFLTCGVDDSRDIIDHEDYMSLNLHRDSEEFPATPMVVTVHAEESEEEVNPVTETTPQEEQKPTTEKKVTEEKSKSEEKKPETSEEKTPSKSESKSKEAASGDPLEVVLPREDSGAFTTFGIVMNFDTYIFIKKKYIVMAARTWGNDLDLLFECLSKIGRQDLLSKLLEDKIRNNK